MRLISSSGFLHCSGRSSRWSVATSSGRWTSTQEISKTGSSSSPRRWRSAWSTTKSPRISLLCTSTRTSRGRLFSIFSWIFLMFYDISIIYFLQNFVFLFWFIFILSWFFSRVAAGMPARSSLVSRSAAAPSLCPQSLTTCDVSGKCVLIIVLPFDGNLHLRASPSPS